MKILIVDDNEPVRKLLKLRFKKAGYETYFAENGKIGVEEAQRIKPDLVLMDLQMPEMSGDVATQTLRKRSYEGLIVAFTASGISKGQKRMMEAGCDHLIVKPPDKSFIPTIADFLQKGRQKFNNPGKAKEVNMTAVPYKILVVDDKENIRKAISLKLKSVGYDCLTAAGGPEALETLAQEKISLVLTDYRMPGMDGVMFNRNIQSNFPEIPVIMFTGDGSMEAATDFLGDGGKKYLAKPFDFEKLNADIKYEIKIAELVKEIKVVKKENTEVRKILETVITLGNQAAQKIRNIHSSADKSPKEIDAGSVLREIRIAAKGVGQDITAITKTTSTLGAKLSN